MKNTLAIVPALGGIASIPSLEMQPVGGTPLVIRAVRTVGRARSVDRVVVATRDDDVAQAVAAEGAAVVWWPQATQPGAATLERLVREVLDQDSVPQGAWEAVVVVRPEAPLATTADVEGTLEAMASQRADLAVAVVALSGPQWPGRDDAVCLRTGEGMSGGLSRFSSDENGTVPLRSATVVFSPVLREAGSVYAMDVRRIAEGDGPFSGSTALYRIEPWRWLVIREPGDLYRARRLIGSAPPTPDTHPVVYVDIDETICVTPPDRDYRRAVPIAENIAAVNRMYDRGHRIVYWTARGGHSGKDYSHLTAGQLARWGAKHHELRMGKPSYDLLICDKATDRIALGE